MSAFGTLPPEPPRHSDHRECAPQFAAAVDRVLDRMKANGFDAIVYEAIRSEARQGWLYGFGRDYDDGRGIVTHAATAWGGWHVFGLAVDIISAAHGWDSPVFFAALKNAYEAEGLTAGASWQMKDMPHGQWGKCRTTPSHEAAELYDNGGMPAVWTAVGAA